MVRLNEFSRKRKLISIIIAIILVLLFFANGVAFNLFTLPSLEANVVSYVILAVALTIQVLAIFFIERRAVVSQERNLHGTVAVENSSGELVTQPEKQLSTELIAQSTSQKASQQNNKELIKQTREKVKLICPACRKGFSSIFLTEDVIVDYGPSKSSNIIRHCPYCSQPIELKRENN